MADDDAPRINPGYAFGQLLAALASSGEQAPRRVEQWRQVIAGLLDGTLQIGSRTPVDETPAWVTLEVAHGGFATGNLAAAGPLQPHESAALAAGQSVAAATDRAALNLYALSDRGQRELAALLASGTYRVRVPEEGALLVTAWLLQRAELERVAALIEAIAPFFDRLRFYPVPHPRPAHLGGVYVQTVGASVRSLRARRPRRAVQQMNEAIGVWAPLYDRAVSLFLETVEGELPTLQTTPSGGLRRREDGQPVVSGGWPCRHYAPDWAGRARRLLQDYDAARAQHTLCGKPEQPGENFARLRAYLATASRDPGALTGRDVGMIRKVLASSITRHGAPGSDRLRATRAMQAALARRPLHRDLARVLADRLAGYPDDEGAPDLLSRLAPLSADEAARIGTEPGEPLPPAVTDRALCCLEAPLEDLIERGLVPSSEVMAGVLPLLTAGVRAASIPDPALARVVQAVYRAFRRRRSLLLLNLESQVRFEELPWIAAIAPWGGSDQAARDAAARTLAEVATLAIATFPHALLPNRLVKELRMLAAAAEMTIPLVDELAADIFMGTFAANYLRAAQVAGRLLRGSLYERYYNIPYDALLALDDITTSRYGAATSRGFTRLCEQRAGLDQAQGSRWSPARNGTVIEQAQILTTHNLASLVAGCDLVAAVRPRCDGLARRCFAWVCLRQALPPRDRQAELQMIKNTAYAWRQMLFYLSLLDAAQLSSFLEWSASYLDGRPDALRRRLAPAVDGLHAVARGARFAADGTLPAGGRRFLGWSVAGHWLRASEGMDATRIDPAAQT